MNSDATDELHALRTRAYGPDADIHGDEQAVRRLQELEELAGERRAYQQRATEPTASAPIAIAPADTAPADTARTAVEPTAIERTDAAASDTPAVEPVASEGDPASPTVDASPSRRRRLILWWIGSLLVAVVATAAVTAVVSRRVQADPREVARLGVDMGAGFPRFLGLQNQDGRVFTTFYGLLSVASTGGWMGGADDQCLAVMDSAKVIADSDSYDGSIFFGCAAGSFPATVQIKVNADSPEQLQDAFPIGTALQFILGSSGVTVLSDDVLSEVQGTDAGRAS